MNKHYYIERSSSMNLWYVKEPAAQGDDLIVKIAHTRAKAVELMNQLKEL